MKPPDESTGPASRDVVPADARTARPGSPDLSFPVFDRPRQERQQEAAGKAIPDAELLNDSGMRKTQD